MSISSIIINMVLIMTIIYTVNKHDLKDFIKIKSDN